MFNELAFIDWIALAFAAVLLAGAAAAAVLAYATSRARTSEPRNGYAHAATTSTTAETLAKKAETKPAHASGAITDNVVDLNDHRPVHAASGEPRHVSDSIEGCESAPSPIFSGGSSIPLSAANDAEQGEGGHVIVLGESGGDDVDEEPTSDVIDLRTAMPSPAVDQVDEVDESELSAQLASRAAKLRGRPEVEQPKPVDALAARTIGMAPGEVATAAPLAETGPGARIGFSVRIPGFFEDPMGRHELRYWDGNRWTEYVKERGERFTDPL